MIQDTLSAAVEKKLILCKLVARRFGSAPEHPSCEP